MNNLLIASFNEALINILDYWRTHTIDVIHEGFVGRVNEHGEEEYLAMAKRAYAYITNWIIDVEYGGVYWSVTADGRPLDRKKQIYTIAFMIYGLATYYAASGEEKALGAAKRLYGDRAA